MIKTNEIKKKCKHCIWFDGKAKRKEGECDIKHDIVDEDDICEKFILFDDEKESDIY